MTASWSGVRGGQDFTWLTMWYIALPGLSCHNSMFASTGTDRCTSLYKNQVSRALPATRVSSEELKQSAISHRDVGELPYKLIFASLLSNTSINDMGGSIIAFWTKSTLTKRVSESDKDHASPVWSIC